MSSVQVSVVLMFLLCSVTASPTTGDDLLEHLKDLKGMMTDLRSTVGSIESRVKVLEKRSENTDFEQNGHDDVVERSKRAVRAASATPRWPPVSSRKNTGAVYVRWGRTTCPAYSQLIYDGYVAGPHYAQKGGGSTKICLPKDPQYEKTAARFQSESYIYGTEYEVHLFNPFSKANARRHHVHDANAVCAVCLALSRPSLVMIPAQKNCPTGWTKEYYGYLMSERTSHHRSSYDCVDIAPEVNDSGIGNQDGALWYIVEGHCGSLPCPPYTHGAELTCVVCTK